MKNVLDNIKLVILDSDIWTGRSALRESDLKLKKGKELPPASLATLGSKFVMDPQKLKVFNAYKHAAVRVLLRYGTRFLGAFAIPNEKIDKAIAEVNEIIEAFHGKKQELTEPGAFQVAQDSWVAANPGWEKIIQNAAISPSEAADRLRFDVQVIEINPVAGQEAGLEKQVNGLVGQLRYEIELQARTTWERSFQGKTEVTQKALRPLRAMLEKIEGLKFLEPELEGLVQGLNATMDSLPSKGIIKGQPLAAACGILSILGNIPEAANTATETETEDVTETEDKEQLTLPTSTPEPLQHRGQAPMEWF